MASTWNVKDLVTGRIIDSHETEDAANWHCGGLNLRAGPGGRYVVREGVDA